MTFLCSLLTLNSASLSLQEGIWIFQARVNFHMTMGIKVLGVSPQSLVFSCELRSKSIQGDYPYICG